MSYDDGVWQDKKLIEIFDRYGIKGTFHLNSAMFGTAERYLKKNEVTDVYRGHEVACHTATHPAIDRCPLPNVAQEVLADRVSLETMFGRPVRGMSYPFGSHSAAIRAMLPSLGICYSRVVGDSFSFDMPDDFLQWKATCHHNHRLMEMAERFLEKDNGVHLKLFYVWGHSYEFDSDHNWDMIEAFCEKVGGQEGHVVRREHRNFRLCASLETAAVRRRQFLRVQSLRRLRVGARQRKRAPRNPGRDAGQVRVVRPGNQAARRRTPYPPTAYQSSRRSR